MKGIISLSHNGSFISSEHFFSPWNRTQIIEKWKRRYGKGFSKAELYEVITQLDKPAGRPKAKTGFKPKMYHITKPSTKSPDSRL